MMKLPGRRQRVGLTPLLPPPAPAPALEPLAVRTLRPLPPDAFNLLHQAFQEGEPAVAASLLENRLPGVRLVAESLDPSSTFTPIEVAPNRVTLRVEPGQAGGLRAFKYDRLGHMLPFLSYVAQKVGRSGALHLDLGDDGAPDRLAFSSMTDSALLPDCIFLSSGGYSAERAAAATAPPWAAREPRVLWRGSTTGARTIDWRSLQRAQLCGRVREHGHEDDYDVGFTNIVQAWSLTEESEIAAAGLMRPSLPSTRFQDFRYHIDIDGNTNSWGGLFIKLLGGGLVFKVASPFGHRQWYYRRLQPWLHFVPIDSSLCDLHEAVAWAKAHTARAEEIAHAGQQLALSMTLETEAQFGLAVIEQALARAG